MRKLDENFTIDLVMIVYVIVMVICGSIMIILLIPNVSAYSNHYDEVMDNQNNVSWSVGDNLNEGDYFHYTICNDELMSQIIWPYHCYDVKLTFISILESYKGNTWLVQGYLIVNENVSPMILFVNPYTFEVSTDPLNVNLGESLENTIFSLSKYGEKSLSIGTVWDSIDSYFTNKINLEIKSKTILSIQNNTIPVSVLSYDIIKPSVTHISTDYPFPLFSEIYSPQIIFPEPKELLYYKLVEYYNKSNFDGLGNNN